MDIKRNGTQPSGKGPAEWFTGTVRLDPLFKAPDPARQRRQRHVRARCAHGLAHTSAWTDADRDGRQRPRAARGRISRANPTWRCRLVPAGREALARRGADHSDDAHRNCESARWQGRRLDGTRHRRAIPHLIAESRPRADKAGLTGPVRKFKCRHSPVRSGEDIPCHRSRSIRR
jgi:hypothetical protein